MREDNITALQCRDYGSRIAVGPH